MEITNYHCQDGGGAKAPLFIMKNDKQHILVAIQKKKNEKGKYHPSDEAEPPQKGEEKYDETALTTWQLAKKNKDIVGPLRAKNQYSVTFTPSPSKPNEAPSKAKRKQLNSWFHNAILDMTYPPHDMTIDKQDYDNQVMDKDLPAEWEDVIVPIHQVLEVSEEWLEIEEEREHWKDTVYDPGVELELQLEKAKAEQANKDKK